MDKRSAGVLCLRGLVIDSCSLWGSLVMVNDEPEFEISEKLDTKINNRRRACKLLYLVRWTGYEATDEETSWILASKLGHA